MLREVEHLVCGGRRYAFFVYVTLKKSGVLGYDRKLHLFAKKATRMCTVYDARTTIRVCYKFLLHKLRKSYTLSKFVSLRKELGKLSI